MLIGLAQAEATNYEQALVTLVAFLGADSSKPPGKGRADAVWLWPRLWIAVEAKSEQKPDGLVSMEYVRKANSQIDSLAADRDQEPPDRSISVIVSPSGLLDPDAVPIARAHLYLANPSIVLDLAHDAVRAWKALRGAAAGVEGETRRTAVSRACYGNTACC
jgi:hypothetical protein